ncbi:amidohydrolase family protein [Salmonella enterica subsp. enterica serovar Agona str. 0322]|nr:amidohydrolase family protein [Salmonella enterica subsp. enterica serovar Agona str. 0322]
MPHEDIGNSQVLLTMVDGNIVWQCQEQVLQIRKGG